MPQKPRQRSTDFEAVRKNSQENSRIRGLARNNLAWRTQEEQERLLLRLGQRLLNAKETRRNKVRLITRSAFEKAIENARRKKDGKEQEATVRRKLTLDAGRGALRNVIRRRVKRQ